jgi:hypothetical protein
MTDFERVRDESLGTALAALDLPVHRPDFFADLEAQLPTVRQTRLRTVARPNRVLVLSVVTAAAIVLVIVALPRIRGSEIARAADVEARVAAAIADVRTARGQLTYIGRDALTGTPTRIRQSFVFDAAGDVRLVDLSAGTVSAYDARRGVERAITTSASIGGGRFYALRRGLAPGPPDPRPTDSLFASQLDAQLGAVTRALAAGGDAHVREVKFRGRPAWRLDVAVTPNTIEPDVDHLSVTVDRESGFPLHVLAALDGQLRSELRLDRLKLNAPLGADAFSIPFPPGAEILRTNAGFRHVDLEQAASVVGYQPLAPATVPDGFRLRTVAAAARAAATGPGQSNPKSRGIVSLCYRRGLEQFVVTTRLRDEGRWRDPFAVEGVPLRRDRVRLSGGALEGATAEVVVDPRATPHLWVVGKRLVVTIAGDLSRADLVAVAESLR